MGGIIVNSTNALRWFHTPHRDESQTTRHRRREGDWREGRYRAGGKEGGLMKREKRHGDEEREEETERKRGEAEGERIRRKEREKVSQAVRQRFSDSCSCDRHKANSHTHTHFLFEM